MLVQRGLQDSVAVQIDPSEQNTPFWVRCDTDGDEGVGVTEIGIMVNINICSLYQ